MCIVQQPLKSSASSCARRHCRRMPKAWRNRPQRSWVSRMRILTVSFHKSVGWLAASLSQDLASAWARETIPRADDPCPQAGGQQDSNRVLGARVTKKMDLLAVAIDPNLETEAREVSPRSRLSFLTCRTPQPWTHDRPEAILSVPASINLELWDVAGLGDDNALSSSQGHSQMLLSMPSP